MASLFIPFPSAFPSAWSSPVCSPPPSCREPALSLGRGGALYQGTSCPLSPAWRGGGAQSLASQGSSPLSAWSQPVPVPAFAQTSGWGQAQVGTARWPRLPPALRVFPSRSLALFLPLSVRLSVSVSVSHHGNSFSFCPHPSDYKSEGKPQAWVCVRVPSWRVGGWGGKVSPAASRWAAPTAPRRPEPSVGGQDPLQGRPPGTGRLTRLLGCPPSPRPRSCSSSRLMVTRPGCGEAGVGGPGPEDSPPNKPACLAPASGGRAPSGCVLTGFSHQLGLARLSRDWPASLQRDRPLPLSAFGSEAWPRVRSGSFEMGDKITRVKRRLAWLGG